MQVVAILFNVGQKKKKKKNVIRVKIFEDPSASVRYTLGRNLCYEEFIQRITSL